MLDKNTRKINYSPWGMEVSIAEEGKVIFHSVLYQTLYKKKIFNKFFNKNFLNKNFSFSQEKDLTYYELLNCLLCLVHSYSFPWNSVIKKHPIIPHKENLRQQTCPGWGGGKLPVREEAQGSIYHLEAGCVRGQGDAFSAGEGPV